MAATVFILQSLVIQRIPELKNYPIEQRCLGFFALKETASPVVWMIIRHSECPLREVKVFLVGEGRAVLVCDWVDGEYSGDEFEQVVVGEIPLEMWRFLLWRLTSSVKE